MKRRVLLTGVILAVLVIGFFGMRTHEGKASTPENLIILESGIHPQGLSDFDLLFQTLDTEVFLDSDRSGWFYVNAVVINNGSSGLSEQKWCFYFGGSPSDYTMIFAEDAEGILDFDVEWGVDLITGLGHTCVTPNFRHSIQNGMDYWYGFGIKIANFSTITGDDIINASWVVGPSGIPAIEYISQALWPHNREATVAIPTPEEIQWGRAIWRRAFDQVPWELQVEVTVDLGNSMDVTPLSQDVLPWMNDRLGFATEGQTIGSHGCYLTCVTMAMNYYAKIMQLGSTTPDVLNNMARENGGFSGSMFVGDAVERLSFYIFGRTIIQDELPGVLTLEGLREELQAGNLVLLQVQNGVFEHYVLAIGIDGEDIIINDPLEARGRGLLSENYGGSYVETRVFKMVSSTPNTGLEASLHSPGELLVTDTQGRRTGLDPRTGQIYNEIPNSSYWEYQLGESEPIKVFGVKSFIPDDYTIEVIGTGTGPYTLHIGTSSTQGLDEEVIEGEISEGEVHTVNLSYDPNQGIVYKIYLPLIRK
jgi:hypothetical protein